MRAKAIVPFGYLPPVVARVVDKFILQLELQLADRNVHIELDDKARAWLTERGYDRLYGARPMGRSSRTRSSSRWPRNCCWQAHPWRRGQGPHQGQCTELRNHPAAAQGGQGEEEAPSGKKKPADQPEEQA